MPAKLPRIDTATRNKLTLLGGAASRKGWVPAQVLISDYPQLQLLAWQMHAATRLTPVEVLDLYERNWRHLDLQNMESHERDLVDALQIAFGTGKPLV